MLLQCWGHCPMPPCLLGRELQAEQQEAAARRLEEEKRALEQAFAEMRALFKGTATERAQLQQALDAAQRQLGEAQEVAQDQRGALDATNKRGEAAGWRGL